MRLKFHDGAAPTKTYGSKSKTQSTNWGVVTMEQVKRRKIEKTPTQCGFFLERKQRHCRMQRRAGSEYCSEHMHMNAGDKVQESDRVPCPNDARHTVWEKDLERHLKKCRAVVIKEDPWFVKDINLKVKGQDGYDSASTSASPSQSDEELYNKYIPILQQISYPELPLIQENHSGLDSRLNEVQIKKHAVQQSSLIGHLKSCGLLSCKQHYYLEFGCGKAELSRFVNLSILEDFNKSPAVDQGPTEYGFGLIDRGVNRMKMDPKMLKDYAEMNLKQEFKKEPEIHRSRIDIKDLDLDKFMEQFKVAAPASQKEVVCISKHLCGVATDLTLKCLLNSSLLVENQHNNQFKGLVVAMCCRHVCSYEQLLPQSRTYLGTKGFDSSASFLILKKIASWAVNGRKEGMRDDEGTDHISGLPIVQREELGQLARRLIDESRLHAIQQILDQTKYEASIHLYVKRDITLENVCLSIRRV